MEGQRIGFTVGVGTHYKCTAVIQEASKVSIGDFLLIADSEAEASVWVKVTKLELVNPLLPLEAIGTLAQEGLSPLDVPISLSRQQLTAELEVLGVILLESESLEMCVFPVRPASPVFYPDAHQVEELLYSERDDTTLIEIGSLRGRPDIKASVDANKIASRHLAILAMTGAGKTVAARCLIRGFFEKDFPILIIDPHGDYFGFKRLFPNKVRLFFPSLQLTPENREVIVELIYKFTTGLTEAQGELLDQLLRDNIVKNTTEIVDYIGLLTRKVWDAQAGRATKAVVFRKLKILEESIREMKKINSELIRRIKGYKFEPLPDSYNAPQEIVNKGLISILYLGGYDNLLQSTIVSLVMENLFQHRLAMDNAIPPFITLLEEAHNFIPSAREGSADVPSVSTLRKLITEGRKFGTGLIIVSQRPSRLDTTLVSQCNTFLILRMINPADQTFVKNVVEGFGSSEETFLPALTPGEGIWSGQSVRFPIQVRIGYNKDEEGLKMNEDVLQEAKNWQPGKVSRSRVPVPLVEDSVAKKVQPSKKTSRFNRLKKGKRRK